jgi:hypothetical protein
MDLANIIDYMKTELSKYLQMEPIHSADAVIENQNRGVLTNHHPSLSCHPSPSWMGGDNFFKIGTLGISSERRF